MRIPALVLDTNAMQDVAFRHWLQAFRGKKILPAVAYTEIGIYFERGGRFGWLQSFLEAAGVEIEWYRSGEADRAIERAIRADAWREHSRDLMIGGHVYDRTRLLVTNNKHDFDYLDDVATPAEVMKRFPARSR